MYLFRMDPILLLRWQMMSCSIPFTVWLSSVYRPVYGYTSPDPRPSLPPPNQWCQSMWQEGTAQNTVVDLPVLVFYGGYNVYISSMMPSTKQKGSRGEVGPSGHGLEIVLTDTEKFLGFWGLFDVPFWRWPNCSRPRNWYNNGSTFAKYF